MKNYTFTAARLKQTTDNTGHFRTGLAAFTIRL
jgi:hypothetical protein